MQEIVASHCSMSKGSIVGVDAAPFKKAMRCFTASVTLITTRYQDICGGLTATAVCSVSVDPAQMLVCVNGSASAHDLIRSAGIFCVNILAPSHRAVADRFAGKDGVKGNERFSGLGEWWTLTTGAPVLKGCPASFDCRTVTEVRAGSHTIYIGEIVDLAINPHADSLIYSDGTFVNGEVLKQVEHARVADRSDAVLRSGNF